MRSVGGSFLLILVLSGFAFATPVGMHSLLIEPGVAASGMGYAYTAVADDPSALYWNPAGLTRGREGFDLLPPTTSGSSITGWNTPLSPITGGRTRSAPR